MKELSPRRRNDEKTTHARSFGEKIHTALRLIHVSMPGITDGAFFNAVRK
jgi:hypothetical protein